LSAVCQQRISTSPTRRHARRRIELPLHGLQHLVLPLERQELDAERERRFYDAVQRFVHDVVPLNVTIDEVKNNLEMRDYIDSNREISPLRQAKDAIILDNTNITEEQQLKQALKWTREILG